MIIWREDEFNSFSSPRRSSLKSRSVFGVIVDKGIARSTNMEKVVSEYPRNRLDNEST